MQQENRRPAIAAVPQLPRRAALARLTANYPAAIARALSVAKIADGTKDEDGHNMVRDFLPGEKRPAAVATAAEFIIGLIGIRIQVEYNHGIPADNLLRFHVHSRARIKNYTTTNLGEGVRSVATQAQMQEIGEFEQNVAQHVFAIMRNDMSAQPDLKEVDFWQDVFRGMADADESGVVAEAARLVFLDHAEEFEAMHMADVLAQATGITRQ